MTAANPNRIRSATEAHMAETTLQALRERRAAEQSRGADATRRLREENAARVLAAHEAQMQATWQPALTPEALRDAQARAKRRRLLEARGPAPQGTTAART